MPTRYAAEVFIPKPQKIPQQKSKGRSGSIANIEHTFPYLLLVETKKAP